MKLTLGCAQFGMNYGYTNKKGKVDENEVGKIIDYAIENDIKNFDTAQSYGNSEDVLGKFISKYSGIKVMSKFYSSSNKFYKDNDINIWEENFQNSLNKLKITKIDSFLIHKVSDLKKDGNEILYDWLDSLMQRKLINRLGLSIYSSFDLKDIPLDKFDLVQMPISIYDQRLIENKTYEKLAKKNIAMHARSILFQGLLLVKSNMWPKSISQEFKLHHDKLLSSFNKELILEMTLSFINYYRFIETALIGVTSLNELKEIVQIRNNLKIMNKCFSDFSWKSNLDLDPRQWN
tara:strand:+ start:209 stop:1081 length:873 start_codon:yes stop_codon:yes gene_type:complete